MNVRIASETWICSSLVQPSESRLWILTLIWTWSWDPLKLLRRSPPHHLSPAQAKPPGRARPRNAHSPTSSHHSNAPIEPLSQSNLSNIVALLTATWPAHLRFELHWRRTLASPPQRAERLALSGDPVIHPA